MRIALENVVDFVNGKNKKVNVIPLCTVWFDKYYSVCKDYINEDTLLLFIENDGVLTKYFSFYKNPPVPKVYTYTIPDVPCHYTVFDLQLHNVNVDRIKKIEEWININVVYDISAFLKTLIGTRLYIAETLVEDFNWGQLKDKINRIIVSEMPLVRYYVHLYMTKVLKRSIHAVMLFLDEHPLSPDVRRSFSPKIVESLIFENMKNVHVIHVDKLPYKIYLYKKPIYGRTLYYAEKL